MNKNRNAGFSLVELIVVIAIMGVLVGISAIGISVMFSRDAEKCATEIESGMDKLRTYSMTKKGDWYLEIAQSGTNYLLTIYRDGTAYEQMNLGNRVTITPTEIKIKFNRVTGGVADIDTGTGWLGAAGVSDVFEIQVDNVRGNKSKTVNLVKLTGRHFIEE